MNISVNEEGSGIDWDNTIVMLDGKKVDYRLEDTEGRLIITTLPQAASTVNHKLTVKVTDNMRNWSEPFTLELQGEIPLIPSSYELFQNFPNPFNPETTIRFQIPEEGRVRIVIYSILGQYVRELLNDYKTVGVHEVVWDGCNDFGEQVSSGVYIYNFISESFHQTRKMILVK